jgi:hypothetical protein
MKREAHTHPKVIEFNEWIDEVIGDALRQAGVTPAAVGTGLLERLWNLTAEHAIQGDIGQFTNERISRIVGWKGDPDYFIGTLVRIGFLDEDPEFRLVVHNWSAHCGEFVHARVARQRLLFVDGNRPSTRKLSASERKKIEEEGPDPNRPQGLNLASIEGQTGARQAPDRRHLDAGQAPDRAGYPAGSPAGIMQGAARSQAKPSLAKPSLAVEAARGGATAAASAAEMEVDGRGGKTGTVGPAFTLRSGAEVWHPTAELLDTLRAEFPTVSVDEVVAHLAEWTNDTLPKMGPGRMPAWIRAKLAEEVKAPKADNTHRPSGAGKSGAKPSAAPWRSRMANGEDLTNDEILAGAPEWMIQRERDREAEIQAAIEAKAKDPDADLTPEQLAERQFA